VIITPITPAELPALIAAFAAQLRLPRATAAFRRVARSSPQRAFGFRAETHRLAAVRLARGFGIAVRDGSPTHGFGWDGKILRTRTEAYVLLHEIAHHELAPLKRRLRFEFGLGPGPETGHSAAARRAAVLSGMALGREEAMASLLGILWEAELGQPALASFLDQNWLEGADRPGTAGHFERTFEALAAVGLVSRAGRALLP
jgi:hypothetical protein